MSDDPRVDALAASELVSSSLLASLVGMLGAKGIFSDEEVREIYVHAHGLLKEHQADEPGLASIYDAALEIIEAELR
ncbi:hypothetical protein IG197_20015 [Aminobacter sp. SR38]|jgi:hypothetical protein|uniref:hypothetical protein n=1 Tax=unclassified Aminobacter TaxID=2644704 RepID=UPI0012B004C2|nr:MULTISPECIES: hypothetical protein [unclassified Aminobacter]MRX37037.1 hypothetical protein [Aminobacter sp. MDW-2]QNH35015.1 hypothetical protein H5P29_03500 [Aminobacter sp. MDW-2]QOF70100.1 hypothetical protein IG197_20015 [Aminobacter sp. SR38]